MRARVAWAVVCCLMVAAVALGQRITTESGIVPPVDFHTVQGITPNQTYTRVVDWEMSPTATGSGWLVDQSTAAGVTITAATPALTFAPTDSARDALVSEQIAGGALHTQLVNQFHKDDEIRLLASVTGGDNYQADRGFFQLSVGDSSSFARTKKPDGFGVVIVGPGFALPGSAWGDWLAYVGNGSDSSYVSLGLANPYDKIFVWAHPGGGPVDFYVNGVLTAHIASPVRTSNTDDTGLSVRVREDNGVNVSFGPAMLERVWR